MAIGDITTRDSLFRVYVGSGGHWAKANGNYWILAYNPLGSSDIRVESYLITPSTGDIGSLVDTQDFSELQSGPLFAKYIADGVVAIWGTDNPATSGDGKIITIAVDSSGGISAGILGSLVWKVADEGVPENITYEYDAVNTSGIYWAFPFRWGVHDGEDWVYTWRVAVVSISTDGATLSVTDDEQISTYTSGNRTNIKAVAGTIFAACVDTGKVVTLDINLSGVITNAGVDSNDFGGSRPWIEKLSNGWFVMAYLEGGNGKLGSFKITDAGLIDNSFTAWSQYDPGADLNNPTVLNLGGSNLSYLVTVYKTSSGSHISAGSCAADGTVLRVKTLTWNVRGLLGITMAQVAYNMFIVAGSYSDDIYSETIEIETPVTVSPSDALVRVTALVIHWSAGPNAVYQEEVLTGGLFSQYFSPISPIKEPEATLPELVQNRQPARDILSKMVPTLREYGEWLGTHSQEEQRAILRGIPGADILTLRVWQEWVVGRRSMGKDI